MKTSVIICTMNRFDDLIKALHSIFKQSILPDELIIVDDGNLNQDELRSLVPGQIELKYTKKDTPGLTRSRNVGIGIASGDVLFFFDDDVLHELNEP